MVAIAVFDESHVAAFVTVCDEPSDIRAVAIIWIVLPLAGWLVTTSVVTVAPGIAGNDGAVGLSLDLLLPQATSAAIAKVVAKPRHTRFIHASPLAPPSRLAWVTRFPLNPAVLPCRAARPIEEQGKCHP